MNRAAFERKRRRFQTRALQALEAQGYTSIDVQAWELSIEYIPAGRFWMFCTAQRNGASDRLYVEGNAELAFIIREATPNDRRTQQSH